MKYLKPILISLFIATLLAYAPLSLAHPGRTDSSGCHTCRTDCASWGLSDGEYHCHGGSDSSGGSSGSTTPEYTPPPLPPISVYVNGTKLYSDQDPILTSGRVMVPIRAIMEALGATVSWEAETQTVNAQKPGFTFLMSIGEWFAFANGNQIILDVPAIIENGRTLVPVRVISESLGATVNWDGTSRTVTITY